MTHTHFFLQKVNFVCFNDGFNEKFKVCIKESLTLSLKLVNFEKNKKNLRDTHTFFLQKVKILCFNNCFNTFFNTSFNTSFKVVNLNQRHQVVELQNEFAFCIQMNFLTDRHGQKS